MDGAGIATKRVNHALLSQSIDQRVRLVGRVVQVNQGSAILEASDGAQVTVHTLPGAQYSSQYVEVIGDVQADLSVSELTWASFGDEFNMENYNELVMLSRDFPDLF